MLDELLHEKQLSDGHGDDIGALDTSSSSKVLLVLNKADLVTAEDGDSKIRREILVTQKGSIRDSIRCRASHHE